MKAVRSLALLVALALAGPAFAQTYPAKPVKMIVPFAPAGPTDVIARLIAQKLSETWGQQVYVENIPGAGGNTGTATAARAPADGYTILVVSTGFIINPSLYSKVPYAISDFAPISLVAASPERGVGASVVAGEVDQGVDRAGEGQSREIQLRPAGHRLDPASRRRIVQAALRARPDDGAVHQRRPRHELDHRRPHADRVHGAAAGHDQHPGRQAARPRGARRQAHRRLARRADHGRSRRSRSGVRHAHRHRRRSRNAEGAHRPLASRDRADHRAAGHQGAPQQARLRRRRRTRRRNSPRGSRAKPSSGTRSPRTRISG